MIAEHLSVEEVEVIRDMFALMDTDNDGKVTYEELKAGLKRVGSQLAEPEIKLLMDVVHIVSPFFNVLYYLLLVQHYVISSNTRDIKIAAIHLIIYE